MKKLFVVMSTVAMISIIPTRSVAQEVGKQYRTMEGEMTITGRVGDSTLEMNTNRLVVALNYETAELVIRLNPRTVSSNSRGANQGSFVNTFTDVLFKGKLGIDYVITQQHPPLDFTVEGYLYNADQQTWITGTGHLEHIHADEYACILNMDFEVAPSVLSIDWPGEDKVQIRIIHTVLKPENE